MATHIKFLVEGFLRKRKKENKKQARIEQIINEFLGGETKEYIHLKKIAKTEIILLSEQPSFSYDFNLKKKQLLEKIKKEFPDIEKIRLTIK